MMNKYFTYNTKKIKFIKVLSLIVIGIFIIFLLMKKFSSITGSICLIRGVIGVPCPSCGMSRAITEVINGDIIKAFKFHPLFWLPFVVMFFLILKRKYFKFILIIAITLLMTVYILRMSFLFPNVEPMKYNEKAIFNQL
ncbi:MULTISPECIES: DUF2752 domain-containing protein [unclassified Clostridium]|uniref:DUF2752 domain-containing protein n=1 Tax=Clostridium TaxID=1485 RepID=UPI001C8CDA7F|nr:MULTISPECIES: DUF2752 domain-containing protein [unclassified Clostridium]MBX9137366.1 DUF2752 domain-containing protein [Clostridium sp. K12(2020)]MBX9144177.1 DUF2752 domain-containing protein [Clostridium sp. K13]